MLFLRAFILLGATFVISGAGPTLPGKIPASEFLSTLEAIKDKKLHSAACCKVCRKGKACGNSCINRSYSCHKGVGCACDG